MMSFILRFNRNDQKPLFEMRNCLLKISLIAFNFFDKTFTVELPQRGFWDKWDSTLPADSDGCKTDDVGSRIGIHWAAPMLNVSELLDFYNEISRNGD